MTEENNIENLKLEIENLRKQSDEYLNGWKRAKADYINLKKETDEGNKEIKKWLSKIILMPLLEIMDNFDAASAHMPEDLKNNAWAAGIEGIKKQMEEYLKAQKAETINTRGQKFDPAKHEAVESVSPDDSVGVQGESGMIAEEVRSGYMIDGEVLRPAKVKIYK